MRHGGGGLVPVDRDAHDLGPGAGQGRDLPGGAFDVGRVGVGHRLDHDRRAAADHDVADPNADRLPPRHGAGAILGNRR